MTDDEVQLYVGCPCGARAGFPCLTNGGNDRSPHGARIRAAAAFLERLIG